MVNGTIGEEDDVKGERRKWHSIENNLKLKPLCDMANDRYYPGDLEKP